MSIPPTTTKTRQRSKAFPAALAGLLAILFGVAATYQYITNQIELSIMSGDEYFWIAENTGTVPVDRKVGINAIRTYVTNGIESLSSEVVSNLVEELVSGEGLGLTEVGIYDTYGSNLATIVFNKNLDAYTNAWMITTDTGIGDNSYFRISPSYGITNAADFYAHALTNCFQILKSGTVSIGFPTPKFELYSFGSGVNEKSWMWLVSTNKLFQRVNAFGGTNSTDFFIAERSGYTLTSLRWTNSPLYYLGPLMVSNGILGEIQGNWSVSSNGDAAFSTVSAGGSDVMSAISGKQSALVNSAGLRSALNDETGGGGAVFSNAPSLYQPTLVEPTITGGATIDTLNASSVNSSNTTFLKAPVWDGEVLTAVSDNTNWVLDFNGKVVQYVNATNDFTLLHCTNAVQGKQVTIWITNSPVGRQIWVPSALVTSGFDIGATWSTNYVTNNTAMPLVFFCRGPGNTNVTVTKGANAGYR